MKKIWIFLVLLGVSFSLTACFGGEQKEESSDVVSSSASSVEASTKAAPSSSAASAPVSTPQSKSASVPAVVEPNAPAGGAEVTTKDEALKIAKEKMRGDPGVVYMVLEEYTSKGGEGEPPAGEYYLIVGKVQNEGNWVDLDGLIFVSKANGDTYFGGDSLEKVK